MRLFQRRGSVLEFAKMREICPPRPRQNENGHGSAVGYMAWEEVRYNAKELPMRYPYTGQYSHADSFNLLSSSLSRFVRAETVILPGRRSWIGMDANGTLSEPSRPV